MLVTSLCSEGSMFQRFYIPKVPDSEVPMFRMSIVLVLLPVAMVLQPIGLVADNIINDRKMYVSTKFFRIIALLIIAPPIIPGMTGPPNSFTARGPVTLTAILFTQKAV